MTPRQAAELIGCSVTHVRKLIRDGKIKAKKVPSQSYQNGFFYSITEHEAKKFKSKPVPSRGWARGKKRS